MIFPITYSRLIARELQLDESGQQALLAGTALTPEALIRLDQWIDQDTNFTIIRNALRLSGNPAFGLHWGSRLHISAHGPLGSLTAFAPTLGAALAGTERFSTVRGAFVQIRRLFEGDMLITELRLQVPMDEVGIFLTEALLATMQNSRELIFGRPMDDVIINVGYPAPAHADVYAQYLRGSIRFGADVTSVVLPAALANTPNPFSDPEAFAQAQQQCELLTEAEKRRETWSMRVTELLRRHPGQLWTLGEVADNFGISPRTLIRHLRAEDTSYQSLLDQELGRQAQRYLAVPGHTVESVGIALGYRDVSAFRRAFKRWFGMSPSSYLERDRV